MNSVAFGQYCEGNSVIHRLDPRFKIILTISYIIAVFLAKNVFAFALLAVSAAAIILLSGINVGLILRSLRALVFIIAFTAVINIFWYKGDAPLFEYGIIHIYREGLLNALFIVVRVVILLVGSSVLLTYTTTPLSLTDGLERLLSPLAKIKVPVHEFSMMMTIALRFIPTLLEETHKIMNAQKARGADFSSGSLVSRAKALIPILVPLFVSAFRRAEELATAMECRCYTGGEGRTRMTILKATTGDYVSLVLTALLIAAICILNSYAPGYSLTW